MKSVVDGLPLEKELVYQTLSQRHYAPYLLYHLIEKATFLKMTDFTYYNNCVKNSTPFELEVISALPQVEERFVKFLKTIEILN